MAPTPQVHRDNWNYNKRKLHFEEGERHSNILNPPKQRKFKTNHHIGFQGRKPYDHFRNRTQESQSNRKIDHQRSVSCNRLRLQSSIKTTPVPQSTKSVEEIVKLLFESDNTSSKPKSVKTVPVQSKPSYTRKEYQIPKPPQEKQIPPKVPKSDDSEPDVQAEWKKYKAANPPLGGFVLPKFEKPKKNKRLIQDQEVLCYINSKKKINNLL